MREPVLFDPIDPPEGASEAELLLCDGRCPECAAQGAFMPSIERDGSYACLTCGGEFDGPRPDTGGRDPVRVLGKIYKRGAAAMLRKPAGELPAVEERE